MKLEISIYHHDHYISHAAVKEGGGDPRDHGQTWIILYKH